MFKNWNYKLNIPNRVTIPLFIAIFIWSFVPSRTIPRIYIYDIPLDIDEIFLCLIVIPYLFALFTFKYFINNWRSYVSILVFFSIALYTIFSLTDSNVFYRDRLGAYVTIVYYTCSFLFAYIFVIFSQSSSQYMRYLTLLVTVASALYLAQSLFSLGFRTLSFTDFGVDRVKGPLFGASTGQILLLPAIGFMLDEIINRKKRNLINLLSVFILFSTLLGLGSRSGLLSVSAFIILSIFAVNSWKNRVFLILITSLIAFASYGLIFSRADSSRLTNLEDRSRQTNLDTAIFIFSNESREQKLFGRGYSSTWAWYIKDKEGGNRYATGEILQNTSDGVLLYHPHSTFLFFIVELGIVGTSIIAIIVWLLAHRLIQEIRSNGNIFLGVALFSAFLSIFLDFFLFKNFLLSSVWLIYIVYFLSSKTSNLRSRS